VRTRSAKIKTVEAARPRPRSIPAKV
jgi:hypothetical protein